MTAEHRRICRSCGADGLASILSLGHTPLANSLLTADQLDEPEPTYPLELAFCPSCTLVQITETIPPERLFRDYVYFSSYSDTMLRHAQEIAERMIARRALTADSLVVEAASNDGYLLRFYKEHGVGVLGIEPAANVAAVAVEEHGVPTLTEFFEPKLAGRLAAEGRRADVFHAHNVLAHVADLNGFVEAISLVLDADGTAMIEVPYVKDMIDRCEFDTIYHEHLCYFSLTALERLFSTQALEIVDVQQVPIHGGTLQLLVERAGGGARPSQAVRSLLADEDAWGVRELATYGDFADRVEEVKTTLVALLRGLKADGKSVAAYGAAAKGSTLLNVCGINGDTLDFVVDRSTVKQGLFLPGVRIPIEPPERLLDESPDYLLLLAWNLADEIMGQQEAYRRRGGRFIIPVPRPQVV